MTYRVELTETAQAEADSVYAWLAARNMSAARWFNGLVDAVNSLSRLPTRCRLASESAEFDEPVRQLLYGKAPHVYRILFVVRSKVVHVLHVRYAARKAMSRDNVVFP